MTPRIPIRRRSSPRLLGGLLLWGFMETAALRRSRRQRRARQDAQTRTQAGCD